MVFAFSCINLRCCLSWPQNIDLCQYIESYKVWGSFRISYSWIYWRGSSWIEHRTREKKSICFPEQNQFFSGFSPWNSYIVQVSLGDLPLLSSGWADAPSLPTMDKYCFSGKHPSDLTTEYCDLTSVCTHDNSYWSNLLLKLPVGESMGWWEG